ncbi:MAG: hypothetical protein IT331_16020 [Anaerolineae bacterium]|nr:hypothetical protein [Anaerolineae bacterium]
MALSSPAVQKAFARAARPIAIIGAVGGFIGDIIQPLGDFALWIAILSFVGALIALIWMIVLRKRAGQEVWDTVAAGLFVLCIGSFVVFAVWTFVFSVGPPRGYLATNVEPIGDLQAQLLGLQTDVTEIKETTTQTATRVAEQGDTQSAQATAQAQSSQVQAAQATAQAQSSQVQVAQATTQAQGVDIQAAAATAQAKGFADLQSQFAALQQGNIVPKPTTPQEWYSNARLYQLKGDMANAIQAYEGYFRFGLNFVDPYIEYSALVSASDGIARARERVNDYYNADKTNPTLDLVSARLLDSPEERLARYTAIATRAPQFGPVFYELGLEYDRALGAASTADLIQKQGDAYSTLLALEQEIQGYTRYYIDKSLADKNLASAQQRFDALAQARNVTGNVDAIVYQYNDGMQFIVLLSESGVKKLLFDIDNPTPTRDTGMTSLGANSVPNVNIGKIQLPVGEHTLYLQYIDANDVPSKVFEKKFVVRPVFATFQQQPLDFSDNTFPGTFLVGVTGAPLETFYTYKWSIDSDALDNEQLGAAMTGIQVKGLEAGEHILYLQAITQDGSKTFDVEEIPFTVK